MNNQKKKKSVIAAIAATMFLCGSFSGLVSCGNSGNDQINSNDSKSGAVSKSDVNSILQEGKNSSSGGAVEEASTNEREWLLNTELDTNQPSNLLRALNVGSPYVGNAFFTTSYNRDYWNDEYPSLQLTEAGFEFLGDKCTYNGENVEVSDQMTDSDGYAVYARSDTKDILFNKHPIFNVDGNLIVSLNGESKGSNGIFYPTYNYTPTAFHIYDKNGEELKSYEIKDQSCYSGFYVFEDIPAEAAAYSFDYGDSYDGLKYSGYTELIQDQIENGEDVNLLPIRLGVSDSLLLTDFGYDSDSLDDDSANPYADDYDKAKRYIIFRQIDDEKIKCHMTIAGFTLNEDGTLSDMEKKTFSLDENTDYTADLLTENKIWFYINE